MSAAHEILRIFAGDRSADSAVPPSGATGHLTTLAAAAMAFLAVLAVAGALAADRLAERWSGALAGTATLELPVRPDKADAAAERARMVLMQVPGIVSVRRLESEETAALLAPWIGDSALLEALDLPVLLAVREDPSLDPEALRLRLEGEVPGALYHRHGVWRDTIASIATRLSWLSLGFLAITLGVTGVVVTLAARASLAMNARVIETLRLLGAQDSYIARAFVRRFTLRSLAGALAGTLAGVAVLLALPAGAGATIFRLAPVGAAGWAAVALVPPVAAALAFVATRRAALRVLRRIR